MIKYGVPYTCEDGTKDTKTLNFDTPDGYANAMALNRWIKDNIIPAEYIHPHHTSYSLKHLAEKDGLCYYTNNEFKHAMMLAGYLPEDPNALNWEYRIELVRDIRRENPNPFVIWLKQFQGNEDGRGDFADDVLYDDDFPVFAHKKCIERYLQSVGACDAAMKIFNELFAEYSKCPFPYNRTV